MPLMLWPSHRGDSWSMHRVYWLCKSGIPVSHLRTYGICRLGKRRSWMPFYEGIALPMPKENRECSPPDDCFFSRVELPYRLPVQGAS